MNVDLELCKRIERAEAGGLRSALKFGKNAFPRHGIETLDVAGGFAGFAGADSPFTQAAGIGLDAPLTDGDVDTLVDFFHSRNAPARVILSPIAGVDAVNALIRRDFTLGEYTNALAADLTKATGTRDPRIERCSDPRVWAEHSARGFSGEEHAPEELVFISLLMAMHPVVDALALTENGAIETTGCLAVESGGVAAFFSTSTLPHARGKGNQTALIADRLARAVETGATLARATAHPASTSERNFHRMGFVTLYTRTEWLLPA